MFFSVYDALSRSQVCWCSTSEYAIYQNQCTHKVQVHGHLFLNFIILTLLNYGHLQTLGSQERQFFYRAFLEIAPYASGLLLLDSLLTMYWDLPGENEGVLVVFLNGG